MKITKSQIRKIILEKFSSDDFKDVYATARMAHTGQKRRSGEDYFTHPSEVRNITRRFYPRDHAAQMVALLHDAIEDAPGSTVDTPEEMEEFIRGSIQDPHSGQVVIDAVKALTHEKNAPYTDYVVGLLDNPLALKVKLADMIHNLSSTPTPRQKQKYLIALEKLQLASGGIPQGISEKHWSHLMSLTENKSLRKYVRQILKEDPMGFVHDLAASDKFGDQFFGGQVGKEAGREIKRAFNKNADHQFLSTLGTVHWGTTYGIESLVGSKGKDELSATMTAPGDTFVPAAGLEVGLWIKGRITLATNDQDKMYSGFQGDYGPGSEGTEEEIAHRDVSSGRNKRPTVSKNYKNYGKLERGNEYMEKMARDGIPYILDRSTWKESEGGWGVVNEALVDNWKPVGIVVGTANNLMDSVKAYDDIGPEDISVIGAGVTKKLFEMAIKFGIPIYDLNQSELWSPR